MKSISIDEAKCAKLFYFVTNYQIDSFLLMTYEI